MEVKETFNRMRQWETSEKEWSDEEILIPPSQLKMEMYKTNKRWFLPLPQLLHLLPKAVIILC